MIRAKRSEDSDESNQATEAEGDPRLPAPHLPVARQ
jgi:hypothetical protein